MSPPVSTSHGKPYIEAERHDELTDGVVDSQGRASDPRKPGGQLEQGASDTPRKGGQAHKGKTLLSHRIEAGTLSPTSVTRARTLRRAMAGEIAREVGGGVCGVVASLLIKFCAQKTAAAEEAFLRGDYEAHRKLSESARMDALYAREHAAKAALSRKALPSARPWMVEVDE
jgi:hypothetical protein